MSLKDYFDDGRDAQRKYNQKQQIRRACPPIRVKPKKLDFYDPRLIIRGAGIIWEMIRPILQKFLPAPDNSIEQTIKRSKQKPVISGMIDVAKRDLNAVLVLIKARKPIAEYEKYREFLDMVNPKK